MGLPRTLTGKKSTVIASQLPVARWFEIIAEATIVDAILEPEYACSS